MGFKLNVFTGVLDITGISLATADSRYLKLDQSVPQTVDYGAPVFEEGAYFNGAIRLKSGQKLIFDA